MIMISNRVSPLKNSVPMSLQIMVLDHAQSSVGTACLILDGQLQGNRSYKKETQAWRGNHSHSCKGWKPSCFSGVSSTTREERGCPSLCVPISSPVCWKIWLLSLLLPSISLHCSRNLTTRMLHSEICIIFLLKLSKGIRIIFIVTSEIILRLLEKGFLKTPTPCPRQGNWIVSM